MKTKQNIVSLLYKNKQHLNEGGYLHFENSIETPVYGMSEDNECLKFHWIDGVQLVFNEEMRIWEVTVWLSTEQSEVLGTANLIFVPETLYDSIYKEVEETISAIEKQSKEEPMETNKLPYDVAKEDILRVHAEMMGLVETTEEQDVVRKVTNGLLAANRCVEIERLLQKFGTGKVHPGTRVAIFKDNRDEDVVLILMDGEVFVVLGKLDPEKNIPHAYSTLDEETQITILKLFKADIKALLTQAVYDAMKSGDAKNAILYRKTLHEEFPEK